MPDKFIFDSYSFDENQKTVSFNYAFDDGQKFIETYRFDFDFADYDRSALDRALRILFLLGGVSYYKAYLPKLIDVKPFSLDQKTADFLNNAYRKGLGELFYKNNLDPNPNIEFPADIHEEPKPVSFESKGLLVAIGGGKDSLVSYELLKNSDNIATWSVGHKRQLLPLVEHMGSNHFWVERSIDPKIIELSKAGKVYNGHIPISAIFAAVGTVVAVLSGYRDIVVSNEQSANEENLIYKDIPINHQYSKTTEFERSYQDLLKVNFGEAIRYYSLLRPLKELAISKQFCKQYFEKYKGVFSSCNHAFTQTSDKIFWCGKCPKCASVYLMFSSFADGSKLDQLFGENLIKKPELEKIYAQLLGIEGDKPLECVGEVAESRWAMDKITDSKFKGKYQSPSDEQIWSVFDHNIPDDIVKNYNLNSFFEEITKN